MRWFSRGFLSALLLAVGVLARADDTTTAFTYDSSGNVVSVTRSASLTDPKNCGAKSSTAGAVCMVPSNGKAICSSGACSISCNTGYTRCGSACANLASDASNCGTCGSTCSGTCSSGVCSK